jgi:hypothetical protein
MSDLSDLINARIEQLRPRLLDLSKRNPLLNNVVAPRTARFISIVDEKPQNIVDSLNMDKSFVLKALPPFDEDELPDEKTKEFRTALENKKKIDEDYVRAIEEIVDGENSLNAEAEIDRRLKDKLREELQLPRRPSSNQHQDLVNHAKIHGINPSKTLPSSDVKAADKRHEDLDLQTLLLPSTLESRVRQKLFNVQRTYEEERGLQVTYLVVGYLEWTAEDNVKENKDFKSPLILIPVSIQPEKTKDGQQYLVSKRAEIQFNPVLKQKLEQDFGFDLKKVSEIDEEKLDIEKFFKTVEKIKPRRMSTWNIKREGTLGIFPFQGIEIHHDLRSEEIDFSKFSVLSGLFGGGQAESSLDCILTEEDTDTAEAIKAVPHLVSDADSSQFLALMKMAKGNNVALEGPPGSGKSQTIVNAIASALYQGKRVLFVAQKKTALDVVFARLKSLDLDKFVLPLINTKGGKDRFYDSISKRINHPKTKSPRDIEDLRAKLKRNKSKISKYISILTSRLSDTQLTVHEILGLAIKENNNILEKLPSGLKSVIFDFQKLSSGFRLNDLEKVCSEFDRYSDQVVGAKLENDSPWRCSDLKKFDYEKVNSVLIRTGSLTKRIEEEIERLPAEQQLNIKSILDIANNESISLLMELKKTWEAKGDSNWFKIIENSEVSAKIVDDLLLLANKRDSLFSGKNVSLDPSDACDFGRPAFENLQEFFSIADVSDIKDAPIYQCVEKCQQNVNVLERIRNYQILNKKYFPNDLSGISPYQIYEISIACKTINNIPWLVDLLNAGNLSSSIFELNECRESIISARQELSESAKIPTVTEIRYDKLIIEETGFFGRIFGRDYSKAIKRSSSLSRLESNNIKKKELIRFLNVLLSSALNLESSNINKDLVQFDSAFENELALALEVLNDVLNKLKTWGIDEGLFGLLFKESLVTEIGDLLGGKYGSEVNWDFVDSGLSKWSKCADMGLRDKAQFELLRDFCINMEAYDFIEIDRLAKKVDELRRINTSIFDLTKQLNLGDSEELSVMLLEDYKNLLMQVSLYDSSLVAMLLDSETPYIGSNIDRMLPDINKIDSLFRELFIGKGVPNEKANLSGQIKLLNMHLDQRGGFQKLLTRRNAIQSAEENGYGNVLQVMDEGGHLNNDSDYFRSCLVYRLKSLVEEEFGTQLMKFTGPSLETARKNLQDLDRQLIKLARTAVSAKSIACASPPVGVGRGRKSEYTEDNLIKHQLGLKRRIQPRALLNRAGKTLVEYFPCWMMDPGSVARHIEREEIFDLVIIDEASQMPPEMSVSALMRGKQALISGDTNQLPPTNFFKGSSTVDEDEDEDLQTVEESILEIANIEFYPKHRLKWHYRSRHESLIAFSNYHVYDDDLVIFPSPIDSRSDLGVSLVRVNGTYEKGINPAEAQVMTDHVVKFMKEDPDRSLGVAVMNASQMEQIEASVVRAADEDPAVAKYINSWSVKNGGLEKFFVKNLENVQGDERDVIFIGTVYGENSDGQFAHRFGPINGSAGKRRLNVLFTRAKEQIVTFTSIPLVKFNPSETNEGSRLLKLWLQYCDTKKLGEKTSQSDSGGIPDSPFEEHVISVIRDMGFLAIPQVGVANYFIDIGVKHPDYPWFLCGIECDGASYHSSKNARDRDRLRQENLERLNWELYRIWSTDWFTDRYGQTKKLEKYLNNLLERELSSLPAVVDPDVSQSVPDASSRSSLPPKVPVPLPANNAPASAKQVGVGCRVVVMDLDGARAGNKRAYWITEIADNNQRPFPEFEVMKPYAPLAQALIRSTVGDIVSYEVVINVSGKDQINTYRVEVMNVDCAQP